MSKNVTRIEQTLVSALFQVNVLEGDYLNLGEILDSLDRLEVISFCESELQMDLTRVLIEPDCWITFKTLAASINSEKEESNE